MITLLRSEVPENHLRVREKSPPSQHGWSIVWELPRVGEHAHPRPQGTWKDKQSSPHSFMEQRCHKSYEDFCMGFLAQKNWLFTNRGQRQKSNENQSNENCWCPAILNIRSIGQCYWPLNEIQWKWLHWELDQVLTSAHKYWKRRLLSEALLPSCVWPWSHPRQRLALLCSPLCCGQCTARSLRDTEHLWYPWPFWDTWRLFCSIFKSSLFASGKVWGALVLPKAAQPLLKAM